MNLNHLHLSVSNAKEASSFYEKFFGFRFAFSEHDGKMIFLKDSSDFLLALHDLKEGEAVNLPVWHYFGFRQESKEAVKVLYDRLKDEDIQFISDWKEGKSWATFLCWAPGPYRLEVSWDGAEH